MAHSDDKDKKHYFNETRGMSYTDFKENTRDLHMKAAKAKPKVTVDPEVEVALRDLGMGIVLGPTWEQADAEVAV